MSGRWAVNSVAPVRGRIDEVRRTPSARAALGAVGVLVGVWIATVHWSGFIITGLAIGIVAATLREAVVAALGVGLLLSIGFIGYAWWYDQLGRMLALGELTAIALVIPPILVIIGSLVRGLG